MCTTELVELDIGHAGAPLPKRMKVSGLDETNMVSAVGKQERS